jgi:beta-lactamase regulating signal transducer with metallopeptidase domain
MHEHIARVLYYFEIHLLFASLAGSAAWLLTALPRGSATAKYWIWVAAALNFIVPAGAVIDTVEASYLGWARPLGLIGDVAYRMSQGPVAVALLAVWLAGAGLMFTRLGLRLRAERREVPATSGLPTEAQRPGFLAGGVPVSFAASRQGPAVHGVLRPHISLPEGIERLLTEHELNAVLVHELTHARRGDNLIRLLYEVSLCLLWFHPLVWLAGNRLALYRELSCDEAVTQSARGRDLVSALAKLANPEEAFLLQASASSFISLRLARLTGAPLQRPGRVASALLSVLFAGVLLACIFSTVAHTACCFVRK